MVWLVLGLVLFLGAHALRIVAPEGRQQLIDRMGEPGWKALVSVVSLAGLALIAWGYGQARLDPTVLWVPPLPMRHIAGLLMLVAFIMLVATYIPSNAIKAKLRHPMVLSVKVWAFAHLLSNGNLADVVLFGAFLLWAVLSFRSARQRDRALAPAPLVSTLGGTLLALAVGLLVWAAFAFGGHEWLIGVSPMGV